jgi:hypothetical protein
MRNPEVTSGTELKVLMWAVTSLTDTEFKLVRPWFVAHLISVDESTVIRSLQHLGELKYLERGKRGGNGNLEYRLNRIENGGHSPPPLCGAA